MPLLRRNYYACECGNIEFQEKAILRFAAGILPRDVERRNVPAGYEIARYVYVCTKCGKEQLI